MKVWRPGITGKLFLAIFATCIVLLISMHWAVRVSFERGFIDYIKHGNEQRLQMLGDALGDQYQQHGNWRFLRNNDRFVFQILRSFEHDNDRDKPGPGMPPHGWRTQFWVVDQNGRVLVGPRGPVPHDGTRRPILVNGVEVGAIIASPVERLTRNTDINFDMQQRRASWMIVALSTLLAALATFLLARGLLAPVKRLVEGTHRLAAGILPRAWPQPAPMSWENWRRTLTSLPARWKKPADAPRLYGGYFPRTAHAAGGIARRTGSHSGWRSPVHARIGYLATGGSRYAYQTG